MNSRRSLVSFSTIRSLPCAVLAVGLTLLGHPATWADTHYTIQRIVTSGDTVGDLRIGTGLAPGTLNDKGWLAFIAPIAGRGEALIQYADGKLMPLVLGGQDAPGGRWAKSVDLLIPISMNQRGNVAFAATVTIGDKTTWGTFTWDSQARTFAPVALVGMPAVNDLTFVPGSQPTAPVINNQDEVAFLAFVNDAAGQAQRAVFFLGPDRKLAPVALPDQELPGGGTLAHLGGPTLNDAGTVTLRVRRHGDPASAYGGYVWEKGTITAVAAVGAAAPGGATIVNVSALRVNNQNRTVLVAARLSTSRDRAGLYRFADGQLAPVVVPGQEMPGGGKLRSVVEQSGLSGIGAVGNISLANELGQYVFLADLEGGGRAAYRVDPDGQLTLILKSGATTELGQITGIRQELGVALNSQGQVALTVRIDGGPETIVLLTPTAP
jgi:hypothetical protein